MRPVAEGGKMRQKKGAEKKDSLRIGMLGDGDIIGTTKKNHVESGLLAA